jgi:hypothetical protein
MSTFPRNQISSSARHSLDDVISSLRAPLEVEGFKLSAKYKFVRKRVQVINAFLLHSRSLREDGIVVTYLTPIVQTDFSEVRTITKKIRGPSQLPCVGGALGRFSPKRSLIEWRLDSSASGESVGIDLWRAIQLWAMPFWEETRSVEVTLRAVESGSIDGKPPYWEDLAAMQYVARGHEAAVQFVLGLSEDEASQSSKEHALSVLKTLNSAPAIRKPNIDSGITGAA